MVMLIVIMVTMVMMIMMVKMVMMVVTIQIQDEEGGSTTSETWTENSHEQAQSIFNFFIFFGFLKIF